MSARLSGLSRSDFVRLLIDDTDEDATEILSVICDGDPRSNRGFDFDAYRDGGRP